MEGESSGEQEQKVAAATFYLHETQQEKIKQDLPGVVQRWVRGQYGPSIHHLKFRLSFQVSSRR